MQNCYFFCRLGQKFRKGTLFFEKKNSGIFSHRVNDILTSILSALHPFLTLPKDVLKRKRGTFSSVSSDLIKGAKRYLFCSWKRCSQKRENGTFKVFKTKNSVFKLLGSHWKSYWLTCVNRWHLLSFNEGCTDFFWGDSRWSC